MAKPLSQVRFAIRYGGSLTDFGGGTYFDTTFGYIEDWSGILSEGPISGDIIEQDWVDGALWQQGKNKTYSFDVPFTALVSGNTVEPNIWDSYAGIEALKAFRGPLLTLRREFLDTTGAVVRQEQAMGVLVTDFSMTVGIGRVIHSVAVFQNLTGSWVRATAKIATFAEDFTVLSPTVWDIPVANSYCTITTGYHQCQFSWIIPELGTMPLMDVRLKTKKYFDLHDSEVIMEAVDLGDIGDSSELHLLALADASSPDEFISFQFTDVGATTMIRAYSTSRGVIGSTSLEWNPVAHRWLRINESNGNVHWDMSPDKVTWTGAAAVPASSLGTSWRLNYQTVGLYLQGTPKSTGVANMANINTAASRVKTASFTETFTGNGAVDTTRWSNAGKVYNSGGRCVFIRTTDTTRQQIKSKTVTDLTGSSATMNLTYLYSPPSNPVSRWHPLQLWSEGTNAAGSEYLGFLITYSSGLKIQAVANGFAGITLPTSIPYDSNTHKWLRISESGGTITWATSANRTTWTTMATVPVSSLDTTLWITATVRMGASTQVLTPTTSGYETVMEIDNLNTAG